MPLRGSYLSITRRVDELEHRAQTLRRGRGCPTCAAWPEIALVDETGDGDVLGLVPEWPPGPEPCCPDCQRTPALVIAIRYHDGAPPEVHLPGWVPGSTS